METRYENGRRYFLRLSEHEYVGRDIPDILINRFRKKGYLECQTIELVKLNQKIEDSHQETILMSDKTVQDVMSKIRGEVSSLYKICESVALLDMIASLVQLATTGDDYTRPELTDCIAVKLGRHPIKEKVCIQTPAWARNLTRAAS
jgi:DNA mismatch repair protein MSH4